MSVQVRDGGPDFDLHRLDDYLRQWLGGSGTTVVARTSGGMSNPTYFVTRGDWRAVLRNLQHADTVSEEHVRTRLQALSHGLLGSALAVPLALAALLLPEGEPVVRIAARFPRIEVAVLHCGAARVPARHRRTRAAGQVPPSGRPGPARR